MLQIPKPGGSCPPYGSMQAYEVHKLASTHLHLKAHCTVHPVHVSYTFKFTIVVTAGSPDILWLMKD